MIKHILSALILAASASAATVQPAATTNDLNNPHKGFMLWGTDYADGAPANYHGATIFHIYVPWREVETADQVFDWATFEANHIAPITNDYPTATFVLRPVADYPDGQNSGITTFYTGGELTRDYPKFLEQAPLNIGYHDYTSCDGDGPGRTPDWNNAAMVTQLVQFIQAFSARYDGDPRITAVQVGLLGLWGEWHQSGCDAYGPSNAVKIAVRNAYQAGFTRTPLQTRYVRTPDVDGVEFGFHEDYFPSFTAECLYGFPQCDDTGDWSLYYGFQSILPAATNNWQSNPVSGESPMAAQKKAWTNDTADILTVLRDYHFSFLGPAGEHEKNKGQAILAQLKRTMGYNYHIVSCTWPDVVVVGQAFPVTLVMTNSGSAPCYHEFPIEWAVCDASGNPLFRQVWTNDLRQLVPGPAVSFTGTVTITNNLSGAYSLRVGLLHPRKNGQPGVLIQSAGRDANDRYTLGPVAVQANDSDADAMPDSWELQQFGSLTNGAGGDVDGDGLANLDEWIAGTEPTNALSVFRGTEIATPPVSGAGKVISWNSATGRVYGVHSASSLLPADFTPEAMDLPATPPYNSWTSGSAQASAFYRISVSLLP